MILYLIEKKTINKVAQIDINTKNNSKYSYQEN